MLAGHLDAENRYAMLRKEALKATVEILKNGNIPNIQLTEINAHALSASNGKNLMPE